MPSSPSETVTLDTKDLLDNANVTIVLQLARAKEWSIRLTIAKWLFTLAAWVAWMNVEFEEEGPPCSPG